MINLGQLLEEGYRPKSKQRIWDENGKLHFWDKSSENLDDGHISSYAWESDEDDQLSLMDNYQIDPYEFYIHPYFPDREIKMIEIVADMPALNRGDLYKVDEVIPKWDLEEHGELPATIGINFKHKKIAQFFTMDFMMSFPQFFKPFYDEMDEIRMVIPENGSVKRVAHKLVLDHNGIQYFEEV